MKKIIFGILVFLVPSLSHADVTTSGVGLLMPTTGVFSPRSSGDKLNENFRIIAATLANQGTAIATINAATGTIVTAIANATSPIWANLYGGIGTTHTIANQIPTFTGVNNSTSNINTRVLNVANSTGIYINGSLISSASITGAGVTVSINGGTAAIVIAGGGGGSASGVSTFTWTGSIDGDVGIGSNTFSGTGAWTEIGRSTWNVIEVQVCNIRSSTVGTTTYNVAYSTMIDGTDKSTWTFIATLTIPSFGTESNWVVPTTTVLNFRTAIALHVTAIPASGLMPVGEELKVRYWRNPNGN